MQSSAPVILPCYIKKIFLSHFRNHAELVLDADNGIIVLTGENGAGKTNILEAISLLSPGRGLRRAKLSSMTSLLIDKSKPYAPAGWALSVDIVRGDAEVAIGTGIVANNAQQNGAASAREKRVVKIDGEQQKSQTALSQYFSCVWLTPDMCHMFSVGNSVRRRFFDRLIYGFEPEHASRVAAYEYHMKERNKLLSFTQPDQSWLTVIEEKMAAYSVAIAVSRLTVLEHLRYAMNHLACEFPLADIQLLGDAESLTQEGFSTLEVEEKLREKLLHSRGRDAASGRCSVGANKLEVQIYYRKKNQEAAMCSTGEQKALLLSILLAHAEAVSHWTGYAPVILLDEIVAHLDKARRKALFHKIHKIGAQAWVSGTDAADFSNFLEGSQLIEL